MESHWGICKKKTLYFNKMENQEVMDKFIDVHALPKLNQGDLKYLNISITSNEIETLLNSLLTEQIPGLDEFTTEFY
jgi:hypothetical protein